MTPQQIIEWVSVGRMTEQSNSAAERSAHVHRGDAPSPADWPVVKMTDGTWKLKSILMNAYLADLKAAEAVH